jgi:hypothetical protein
MILDKGYDFARIVAPTEFISMRVAAPAPTCKYSSSIADGHCLDRGLLIPAVVIQLHAFRTFAAQASITVLAAVNKFTHHQRSP